MPKREDSLIEQIERDALDDQVPVATALRKCIVLGGKSGSEKLRDWATRELKGYGGVHDDDLPPYRVVAAPLMVDAVKGNVQIKQQQVAPSILPDGIREYVKEEVPLRDGVGQIEALLKQPQIKISLPGSGDLVRLTNHEIDYPYQQIVSIYWAVAHATIEGIIDQIRTALTQLVAELRATMSSGDELPSAEAANQAVNLVVTGKRARVNVANAQSSGSGTTATVNTSPQPEESGFWTRSRRIGAFVVGAVSVAAGVVAVIQFVA